MNDRYRYIGIGDISKVEDTGLSVFAANLIRYVTCTLLPGTNQLVITQASCHYAKEIPIQYDARLQSDADGDVNSI